MQISKINKYEFKAIPTLGIYNYQTAINFYIGFLGFKIDWEHRFAPNDPVYMQISNKGLILHLSENKRFINKSIIFVDTINLRDFHNEINTENCNYLIDDLVFTKWQTIQLEIEDPFGNLLRFNENII